MWTKEKISQTITQAMADAKVAVDDLTGTSDHFQVLIVSDEFEGMSSIERHRKIYEILGSDVGGAIHALSLQTFTPTQWQNIQNNAQTQTETKS